ncbi:hypothetical protein GCM10022296_25880 [Secundilactobacillus similis DSM 23365 = JCM 2765]
MDNLIISRIHCTPLDFACPIIYMLSDMDKKHYSKYEVDCHLAWLKISYGIIKDGVLP